MNIKKSANLLINFTLKRLTEIFGLIVFMCGVFLLIALLSYSPEDPNFIFPDNTEIKNLFGFYGSFISDLFFQSVGIIAFLISLSFMITGVNIFINKDLFLLIENTFFIILYTLLGSIFFSFFYSNTFTLYINGNGGFVGTYLKSTLLGSLIETHELIVYYLLKNLTNNYTYQVFHQ